MFISLGNGPVLSHISQDTLTNKDSSDETVTSFQYTYDLDGLITKIERETGDNMVYEYDDLGAPKSVSGRSQSVHSSEDAG